MNISFSKKLFFILRDKQNPYITEAINETKRILLKEYLNKAAE